MCIRAERKFGGLFAYYKGAERRIVKDDKGGFNGVRNANLNCLNLTAISFVLLLFSRQRLLRALVGYESCFFGGVTSTSSDAVLLSCD